MSTYFLCCFMALCRHPLHLSRMPRLRKLTATKKYISATLQAKVRQRLPVNMESVNSGFLSLYASSNIRSNNQLVATNRSNSGKLPKVLGPQPIVM